MSPVTNKTPVEFAAMSEVDQLIWVRSCTTEQRAALIDAGGYSYLAHAEGLAAREWSIEVAAWMKSGSNGPHPESPLALDRHAGRNS